MGKPKYIETPEKLWELFIDYTTPPLTMAGFECYCLDKGSDAHHYFDNTDNRYDAYRTICIRIKKRIRQDQIEGGMVGQFNSSITQRLNGLTEKTDITTNGENITKIEIEIVKGTK